MRPALFALFALALLACPGAARAQDAPVRPSPAARLDAPHALHGAWIFGSERERHVLRSRRYAIDLRPPISLTGLGAGTVLVGALMVIAELAKGYLRDPDVILAGAIVSPLGALVLLTGSLWWGVAAHRGRVLDQAIDELDTPELRLDLSLELGVGPSGVALRGRF